MSKNTCFETMQKVIKYKKKALGLNGRYIFLALSLVLELQKGYTRSIMEDEQVEKYCIASTGF